MSRSLPTTLSTAIGNPVIEQAFWAVDLLFDSPNELYLWSALGDITLGSNTYTGAGDMLAVSELQESSDLAAYGATLTISGLHSSLVNLAFNEPYRGRQCLIHFGVMAFDALPTAIVTPFSGRMDEMNFDIGPKTSTISLKVESRFIDFRRPRVRRFTDEEQQSRFSGDLAYEFVNRLQKESLEWKG